MSFALHPKLENDTFLLGAKGNCHILLMNDQRFPWLIVVPAYENITELHQLEVSAQATLLTTVSSLSDEFQKLTGAHKMNLAALGNQVPQLHIHIIARYRDDVAWPNPV